MNKEQLLYGVPALISDETKDMTKYQIKGDTTHCNMRFYHLFPGVDYVITSFTASECGKRTETLPNVLEISYCKGGRFECEYKKGFYTYVGEGDFAISSLNEQLVNPSFPLGHYQGFAIIVDLNITGDIFSGLVDGVCVNFRRMLTKFCPNNQCTVIKSPPELLHVFNELYDYHDETKSGYLRLKVLEIFFLLSEFLPEEDFKISDYFSGEHTRKVKSIKKEITKNLDEKIYLNDLSKRYDIAMTTMKECFKAVYGKPIIEFRREYKMQKATQLLLTTDKKIIEIANDLGYENPNKFSSAFKKIIGCPPSEYRKRNIRLFG